MNSKINNLASIFDLYSAHLKTQHPNKPYCNAKVKTAIVRYTLPGWGLNVENGQDPLELMALVPINQFKDALTIQEKVFKSLGKDVSGTVQRTYRSQLRQLLNWCAKQRWWKQEHGEDVRAPKKKLAGFNSKEFRVTNKPRKEYYGLTEKQLTETLKKEFSQLFNYLTSISVRKRQEEPIKKITANLILAKVKLILGWLHTHKEIPLKNLTIKILDDIDLTYEFLDWARTEREIAASSEAVFIRIILSVAKFHHHKQSNVKDYRDIPIIEELRELLRAANKRIKNTPKVADENKKWLDWSEYLAAVERLKEECALRLDCGQRRSDKAIAWSYQRYLIAAFLAYMPPDRQRTLRELELGRTLIKDRDKWFINLGVDDYKTGKVYGEQISEVPEIIYPELEEWLNKWRLAFNPKHNFVFSRGNGKPMNEESIYTLFTSMMCRLTGKRTNPHLVRAMAITHFQRSGATDAEMEALALAMKHSREMQREVYDKRTQQEKIAPALNMMLRQKASTLPPPPKLGTVKLDPIE